MENPETDDSKYENGSQRNIIITCVLQVYGSSYLLSQAMEQIMKGVCLAFCTPKHNINKWC